MQSTQNFDKVSRNLIIWSLIMLFLIGIIFMLSVLIKKNSFTVLCIVCGILGGLISIQQRLRKISEAELIRLSSHWYHFLLIPIFGGFFALILYVMFYSGIITGDLFPKFIPPDLDSFKVANGCEINSVLNTDLLRSYNIEAIFNSNYASPQDIAKHALWSFFAGFSERLVPRIINQKINLK